MQLGASLIPVAVGAALSVWIAMFEYAGAARWWGVLGQRGFLVLCLLVVLLGVPAHFSASPKHGRIWFRIRLVFVIALAWFFDDSFNLDCLRALVAIDALGLLPPFRAGWTILGAWAALGGVAAGSSFTAGDLVALDYRMMGPGPVALLALAFGLLLVRRAEQENTHALLQSRNDALSQLAAANVSLQDFAAKSRHLATLQERTRIARDIHDTIGHALTSIIVQAKASRKSIPHDPDQVLRDLNIIEARQAIAELRTEREEQESGRELWLRVGKVFAQFTGMQVTFDIAEDFAEIPSEEQETQGSRHGQVPRRGAETA